MRFKSYDEFVNEVFGGSRITGALLSDLRNGIEKDFLEGRKKHFLVIVCYEREVKWFKRLSTSPGSIEKVLQDKNFKKIRTGIDKGKGEDGMHDYAVDLTTNEFWHVWNTDNYQGAKEISIENLDKEIKNKRGAILKTKLEI